MDSNAVSYAKHFLSMWFAFAMIMLLQSWSIAASIVPALLPTLICVAAFALSALVIERFWPRVLACNLLIGLALGLLHLNVPENYTSRLAGTLLTQGGRHTAFGHLIALLSYAVIIMGNLIGFIGYRYWVRSSSRPLRD
jgi:hypothetical protein